MKNQQMIKLFIVLLFSTAFIFSFSHFGAQAFDHLSNANGNFSDGTKVGDINLSGKPESEVTSLLETKYADWIKNTKINLQYREKSTSFDLSQFQFDANQTIDSIKNGQKNIAYITLEKTQVEEQLQILFPQLQTNDIDLVKLTKSLIDTASQLANGNYNFDLNKDFWLAGHEPKDTTLNVAILNLKHVTDDLQDILETTSTIEIPEKTTFSLLDFVKKHKLENTSSLNILATGIYQAILPSNFTIDERNISSTLPDYAKLGFEAKVNPTNNEDLIISNPNESKYSLKLRLDHNKLFVVFIGEKFLYDYKITAKFEQNLIPKKILQFSPLLVPGKTDIKTKGVNGEIVKIYRDIYQQGQLTKSELISDDYYPPVYQVEVHALTGSVQGTNQPARTTGNQSGAAINDQTVNNSSNGSNATVDQSSLTNNSNQSISNDNTLWGKTNEQPK